MKYILPSSVIKKHKKIMSFLWISTWILFLPFAILEYIHDFNEHLLSFVANLRNKIVYGIAKILFRKECKKV